MKRLIVILASVVGLIAFSVTVGGAAWSAAEGPSSTVIHLDSVLQPANSTHPAGEVNAAHGTYGTGTTDGTGDHQCGCSTTTTTTTPPPTTTTTGPPVPTTSTTTTSTTTTSTTTTTMVPPAPPNVVPPSPAPPPGQPPVIVPVSTQPTSLPFTGVNTKPLLIVGLLLVALGLCLLASPKSWRRMRHRLLTAPQRHWSIGNVMMLA